MITQYEKVPAYVLHQRNYRESSLLVDLLTRDAGIVRVVAQGAHRNKSPWRGLLQAFVPLVVSWSAKSELGTLKQADCVRYCRPLSRQYLLSGLYINELIMRLVYPYAPVGSLFDAYQTLHTGLLQAANQFDEKWQRHLRVFEKQVLTTLGVGLDCQYDCLTETPIEADKTYRLVPEQGFTHILATETASGQSPIFQGQSLMALDNEVFPTIDSLNDAKRIMRMLFKPLLGRRSLKSRDLFV